MIATNWQKQNYLRGEQVKQKQNYLRGEQVKLAKLTADAVEEIRSAQKQRDHLRMHIRTLSNKALAARHKVSVSAVEAVLRGRTWMHIT